MEKTIEVIGKIVASGPYGWIIGGLLLVLAIGFSVVNYFMNKKIKFEEEKAKAGAEAGSDAIDSANNIEDGRDNADSFFNRK